MGDTWESSSLVGGGLSTKDTAKSLGIGHFYYQ